MIGTIEDLEKGLKTGDCAMCRPDPLSASPLVLKESRGHPNF